MKIPVIGTVFTDIKGHPFETFIPDGRNAGYIETVHGGVGRNIAEDLAMLGAQSVFVSLVTPDGTGEEIINHLNQTGVETSFIARTERGSGTWLAIFDEKGDVVSSISVRAELGALLEVLDAHHEKIFADADYIILEVDIDTPAVERVFRYARQYGKKICCAIATMSHALDKKDYIRQSDLFICNRQEAGMLFDEDFLQYSANELAEILPDKIRRFGLKNMIVTLSSEGSLYFSSDGAGGFSEGSSSSYGAGGFLEGSSSSGGAGGFCPAEKVTPVDSTGAGDSYCAGVVSALCRGASLPEACAFAARVSAAVVASEKNVLSEPLHRNL